MSFGKNHPLPAALEAACLLRIAELKAKGGPTDWDWSRAREAGDTIAFQGDALLFSGKRGDAAQIFNKLANAVSCAAFLPGGITVFGMHFEAIARSDSPTAHTDKPASTL